MTAKQDDFQVADEFRNVTGMPLEEVITLYTRAVNEDLQTVGSITLKAINKFADTRAESPTQLLALARAIIKGEGG